MNIDDIVMINTTCPDCGDVPAKVIDIIHDRAFVEVIGDLPHGAKERSLWIPIRRLRLKDE